jgi:hypothetical protein
MFFLIVVRFIQNFYVIQRYFIDLGYYMDFTKLLAVDDLFAIELAMIFSFHVN